ncbi:MAG: hypothetical protein IPM50_12630 [Acidobacteriota bacterium]|nr:MAG: hypothetical protein IPM50_12630 [Acidobacteriota bacterium]
MEPAETLRLSDLPLGGRLLVRAKTEWRNAAISRIGDERVSISVESRRGRTYKIFRHPDTEVAKTRTLFYLICGELPDWRTNFLTPDPRW